MLAWHLAHEGRLSQADAARLAHIRDGRRLLVVLARVLPMEQDGRYWCVVAVEHGRPESPEQRAAVLAWEFAHGAALTVSQAAQIVGLQYRATLRLLGDLSYVLPIVDSDRPRDRVWSVMEA